MFAGHTLATVADDGPVYCWRLECEPGRRTYMVEITSTPEGIHITGDTIPAHDRGGVIARQSLEWWAGELDADYLAGKFLKREWTVEAAQQHLDSLIAKLDASGIDGLDDAHQMATELRRIKADQPEVFDSAASWQKVLHDRIDEMVHGIGRFDDPMIDADDAYPSHEHRRSDAALLAAIHSRFRTLFMERYKFEDRKPVPRGEQEKA